MARLTKEETRIRIGVIDTGVNPWHSHVRGGVTGLRIYLDGDGRIREDDDFRDLVGHGTAVAGILRRHLPYVEIFAVRVFERDLTSYPSLVARAVLRAAAGGCSILNLSLGMSPGPGSDLLTMACNEVMEAGCIIVAAGHPDNARLLPASIPGVLGVVADDLVPVGEIRKIQDCCYPYAASGSPCDLEGVQTSDNIWGNSFACARATAFFAAQLIGRGSVPVIWRSDALHKNQSSEKEKLYETLRTDHRRQENSDGKDLWGTQPGNR